MPTTPAVPVGDALPVKFRAQRIDDGDDGDDGCFPWSPTCIACSSEYTCCVCVAYLIDKLGVSWASRVIIADGREVAV
jgi:hypothetical protein